MEEIDYSNKYCMHTVTCGELRAKDIDKDVVLCG